MSDTYLFPYEYVDKNTKIILYGAGKVGKSYIEQIVKTGYCEIVDIVDSKVAGSQVGDYIVKTPESILEIKDYTYVVVATTIRMYASEIIEKLLKLGIDKKKIICATERTVGFWNDSEALKRENHNKKSLLQVKSKNILRIAFLNKGGLGDTLMDVAFVKQVKKMIPRPVQIDYYCRAYKVFHNRIPFIDNVYSSQNELNFDDYDLVLYNHRYWMVDKIDREKVEEFSPQLYALCEESEYIVNQLFNGSRTVNSNLITQLGELRGKNRIEQANMGDIIDFDRNTKSYMPLYERDFKQYYELELDKKKYITICRSTDNLYDGTHTKLWPLSYYNELIRMIKEKYPELLVVQVGSNESFGMMDGVDLNLVGKTTLPQIEVVLKKSILHIDGEGGLTHMRHLLNGRSIVLFGPTTPKVYGYDNNINIKKDMCENGCTWISGTWMKKCMLGYENPTCMYSITPEDVFKEVCAYIDNLTTTKLEVMDVIDKEIDVVENISETKKEQLQTEAGKVQVAFLGKKKREWARVTKDGASDVYILDDFAKWNDMDECVEYFAWAKEHQITADYSNKYNVSADDEQFSITVALELADVKEPLLQFEELKRITKNQGVIYCTINKQVAALLSEAGEISVNENFADEKQKKWVVIKKCV